MCIQIQKPRRRQIETGEQVKMEPKMNNYMSSNSGKMLNKSNNV